MFDRQFSLKYCMNNDAFWLLLEIISPHLPSTGEKRKQGGNYKWPYHKRSTFEHDIEIIAGGDPLNIVMMSLIKVCGSLLMQFTYPRSLISNSLRLIQQTEGMNVFKSKTSITIDCYIGAIDGMLIWISKHTIRDQSIEPTKFFCDRKMKYGIQGEELSGLNSICLVLHQTSMPLISLK